MGVVRLGALALLVACGRGEAPPTGAGSDAPAEVEAPDITPVVALPPFSLTTQAGVPFTREDLLGHVTVVDFIFTSCPDVCPMLSARMAEIAKPYADKADVRFLSISVDPEVDTPEVLTRYAARFGADPARWTWLTGPEKSVHDVVVDGFRSALQRMPPPEGSAPDARSVLHGERFVVVDRAAVIRGYPSPREQGAVEAVIDAVRAEK